MFKNMNTIRIFLENPSREFNVRELARILKISPATASKNLQELEKKGILKKRKERMLKLYPRLHEAMPPYMRCAFLFFAEQQHRTPVLLHIQQSRQLIVHRSQVFDGPSLC